MTLGKKGTLEEIAKIFPNYFERFTLPEGAKEEAIKVYRVCKSRSSNLMAKEILMAMWLKI